MQFTGLKDKAGVEIYEGDIVELSTTIDPDPFPMEDDEPEILELEGKFSVLWNHQYGGWELRKISGNAHGWSLNSETPDDLKVIGNIYQDPNLLV